MIRDNWKTLNSIIVYRNRWMTVREDKIIRPDGSEGIYSVIENAPSVHIVALTNQDEVYLIGQFRYTTKTFSWEIPAGGADETDLLSAAKRELQEETGLTAEIWEETGKFHTMNGISGQMSHVFVARNLSQTDSNNQEEEGISHMKCVPLKQAFKMIKQGEITDSDSISALIHAALWISYI